MTLVTLIAGEYALRQERVLLVDADQRQNLSAWWTLCNAKGNAAENIDVVVAATHTAIEKLIRERGKSVDLIIIDAAGVDSTLQTTILRSSNLVLSPIQPAIKEIEAAGQTVAAVNELNDELGLTIRHLNVRTRVSLTARNLEAYRYIRPFIAGLKEGDYQTDLLDTELFERNIYREIQNGLGTLQMQDLTEPVRKGRAEVQALVNEIERRRFIASAEVAA